MGRISGISDREVNVSPNLEGQELDEYYNVNPDVKGVVIPPRKNRTKVLKD